MQSLSAEHADTGCPRDPLERELREIEELCARANAHPALLHCSAAARYLVREELPRLIALIRNAPHPGEKDAPPHLREVVSELRRTLRREAEIVRDLVERT